MITSVATSISTYVFNVFLMRHTGYLGVAALTIVFYLNMLVNFSTLGMAQTMYPLISYHVGARNYDHIRTLLRVAMKYSFFIGLGAYLVISVLKDTIIGFFINGNMELSDMTRDAVTFMAPVYLISFINIIGSSFHTAIERPLESAVIAVCKSLVFVLIPLTLLPGLFESMSMDYKLGIWLSIPVGEVMCLFVTVPLMYFSTRRLMRALM